MKKYTLCLFICLHWLLLPLAAQEAEDAPEDPGLLLPSILLEIEDLSVEKIEAGLPEESEILLPARDLFLPEDVTLDIREPAFDIDFTTDLTEPGPGEDSLSGSRPGTTIIAEGMLGAGNVNTIVSRISFYKPGSLPRYKFLFNHALDDGYANQSTGIGFGSRLDELTASLLLNIGTTELDSQITFTDRELGLQGQGDYFSVISRFISIRNQLKNKLSERITLSGGLDYDLASLILTGGTAVPAYPGIDFYPPSEMLFTPQARVSFTLGAVTLGLGSTYRFRNVRSTNAYDFNRFYVTADLRLEFPFWLNMTGAVSYFYSNAQNMLFPFELAFSGNPSNYFSFGLKGGYFLEENNFSNLLTDNSYMDIPASLVDNRGWFGGLTLNINLIAGALTLMTDALIRWNDSYYSPSLTVDTVSGLRSFTRRSQVLSSDTTAGFEWSMSEEFNWGFKFKNFYLWDLTMPVNENSFSLDAEYQPPERTWGLTLNMRLLTGTLMPLTIPVMDLAGFVKASENINVSLSLDDLLQPLLGERISTGPFISAEIKGILKIEIFF